MGIGRGRQVIAAAKASDMILMMLDAGKGSIIPSFVFISISHFLFNSTFPLYSISHFKYFLFSSFLTWKKRRDSKGIVGEGVVGLWN